MTGIASNDENISAFGLTNFRGINHQFGMLRRDRSRHIYIIGQTGAGKSGLLELFALSDVFYNQGYCIIDPHGDFAVNNLRFVPASRVKDVIYFNPADTQFPVGFNPLEVSDASKKPNVCSEVIGVLKRMFGDSWGPRLEHILRYTLLALLDRPETTLLDISRLLTDKEFRKETLDYCTDVTVLQFWKHEFGQWNDKQINESIAPVLNKVGAFTANPIIRNIIGQPKSTFNVRKIMDEGKILVVNLSKGLIGEDNAGILGAFLVTKIQLAAMSRSDIPEVENRRPFYLYVDEFQNFATDSFAVILSEARKYGLNLTVANQYISQMTENVRNAVFGNVGTTISFRVSADDAPILSKQFTPVFDESDLIQMNNRHFVISMIIGGEKVPAFSATTLNIPHSPHDNFDQIIAHSREYYSHPRAEIERQIRETIEQSEKYKQELSNSGRQPADKAPRENLPTLTFINGKPSMSTKPFDTKKYSPNSVTNQAKPGLKDLKEILEAKTSAQTHSESQSQSTTQNQEQGNTPLFVNHGTSTPVVTQNSTPVSTKNPIPTSTPTSTPVSTSVNSPVTSPNAADTAPEASEQASQSNTANQPDSTGNHAQASENALNSAPSTSSPNPNGGTHESHAKPQGNRSFKNRNFRNRNNFKKKGNKPTSVSGPKPTPIN
ncbi:type IV secretion system DNA-binding domain-containing protein [Candidatus Saccharibacteria bacterium]|nr:type IV secretion system DNA-binding domain-containing protein [Candidatus Saccharibacteria bacterium]